LIGCQEKKSEFSRTMICYGKSQAPRFRGKVGFRQSYGISILYACSRYTLLPTLCSGLVLWSGSIWVLWGTRSLVSSLDSFPAREHALLRFSPSEPEPSLPPFHYCAPTPIRIRQRSRVRSQRPNTDITSTFSSPQIPFSLSFLHDSYQQSGLCSSNVAQIIAC
jgi:hypothetical protein